MATYDVSYFGEEVYYTLLRHCNTSRHRVEDLTRVALRHLCCASDVWAAVRRAMMEQSDLDSERNRALWYVTDALLKHCPVVFVPIMSPRLFDLVLQQMPWRLVRYRTRHAIQADELLWCERLIRSWRTVLPAPLYKALEQHAIQCRSEAQLSNALLLQGDGAQAGGASPSTSAGAAAADTPATTTELRELREGWDVLRYWCLSTLQQQQRSARLRRIAVSEDMLHDTSQLLQAAGIAQGESDKGDDGEDKKAGQDKGATARPDTSGSDEAGEGEEDDDDYSPDFIPGAVPRALPQLDLPMQRRRREAARRRQREDDY